MWKMHTTRHIYHRRNAKHTHAVNKSELGLNPTREKDVQMDKNRRKLKRGKLNKLKFLTSTGILEKIDE